MAFLELGLFLQIDRMSSFRIFFSHVVRHLPADALLLLVIRPTSLSIRVLTLYALALSWGTMRKVYALPPLLLFCLPVWSAAKDRVQESTFFYVFFIIPSSPWTLNMSSPFSTQFRCPAAISFFESLCSSPLLYQCPSASFTASNLDIPSLSVPRLPMG